MTNEEKPLEEMSDMEVIYQIFKDCKSMGFTDKEALGFIKQAQDNERKQKEKDNPQITTEQAVKIAEALTNLIADMEAKDTWSVHINALKKIVEEAE